MNATSSPRVVRTAAALMIGGELLSAKIRDQNLEPLAALLRSLGIRLERVVFVPDVIEEIADEVRTMRGRYDVVFTSGGVGPTHDDVTVEAVARALDVPLVVEDDLLALLDRFYGDEVSDSHRLMARIPQGAELLEGKDIRWPTIHAAGVWVLPGVPELFRMKLAVIREHLRGPTELFGDEVRTTEDEVLIKNTLDEVVAAHPSVEVGSYPKWFDDRYKTRITFDGTRKDEVQRAADDLRARLGKAVVPEDD